MKKVTRRRMALVACCFLSLGDIVGADTLKQELVEREKAGSGKISPDVKKAFAEGIAAVKDAKVVENAKQVGDDAPDFTLKNAAGLEVNLSEQLKLGPVVLTWYRGGWCPYCNITLAALQRELSKIKAAGASLIALTPELPDNSLNTIQKNALQFEVLTDLNHRVAEKYQIVFELTPEVEKLYGQFFDLKEYNGAEAGTKKLPLAATYIIGKNGKIKWAFLHHDYHKRAEPAAIVKFLQKIADCK